MSFSYSDMDQLVLQRWPDVMGLIEAHRDVQGRIEEMVDIVGERIARWARPLGFETSVEARNAEYHAWRPAWADRRKGPKVTLVLGGVCPAGFRKVEAAYPFQWLYIKNLADFRVKDAERAAFSQALRVSLGDQARRWEAEDVDDTEGPLGHYLTGIDNAERAKLVSNQDSLLAFATENFRPLFQIADVVEGELVKLGK